MNYGYGIITEQLEKKLIMLLLFEYSVIAVLALIGLSFFSYLDCKFLLSAFPMFTRLLWNTGKSHWFGRQMFFFSFFSELSWQLNITTNKKTFVLCSKGHIWYLYFTVSNQENKSSMWVVSWFTNLFFVGEIDLPSDYDSILAGGACVLYWQFSYKHRRPTHIRRRLSKSCSSP